MSLLSELEARGVTAEDLEKAASVRYFEKAAAAEGVNLDELDEGQVEELYASFIHNTASTVDDHSKEASAMDNEIVDLFEKTAAAEGIDLDAMDNDDLAELYAHYVENVLPEQIDEFGEFDEAEKDASEEEAYEKLAEAEILGRHMARAYMDEMDKDASARERAGAAARRSGELLTARNVRENVREVAGEGATRMDKLKAYGRILRGGKGMEGTQGGGTMSIEARKSLATQGGAAAALAASGYGAKKLYDRRKEKNASAEYDDVVSELAIEMLADSGFEV